MESWPALLAETLELYGAAADLYDAVYGDDDYYDRSSAFVLERIGPSTAPTILDLCAGTGSHARRFAAAGARVVAVDRSARMLVVARTKAPAALLIRADIRELELSERFDAVVCLYGAIHYLETEADFGAALRAARNHLAPGGLAVFELRDGSRVSSEPVTREQGPLRVVTRWFAGRGTSGSDLYVVAAFDADSGRHFVEVHNLFQTDPRRVARWAERAGLADVRLLAGYTEREYGPDAGGDTPVLVARRPD